MSTQKTCGPLYKEGLEEFTAMDQKLIPVYAAGFISGQAEKIHLGACRAAMFRPSSDWFEMVENVAQSVAKRYGLRVSVISTSRGPEIWLCDSEATAAEISLLPTIAENSDTWHWRRGIMCGIPSWSIDPNFHLRTGHNDPCDV